MADPAWTPSARQGPRGRWQVADGRTHDAERHALGRWAGGLEVGQEGERGTGDGEGVDYERGCEGRTQLSPADLLAAPEVKCRGASQALRSLLALLGDAAMSVR